MTTKRWPEMDGDDGTIPDGGAEPSAPVESPTFAYSLAMYLTRNGQVRDAPKMQKEIEDFLRDMEGLEKALLEGNRIAMKTIKQLKAELGAMTKLLAEIRTSLG